MRILIADDHILFRDGLRSLLEARGIEVVGEARDGHEAVALAMRTRPDLILLDLKMPEMDGLEAMRVLVKQLPEAKVVILTASESDDDLFEAIKSGAQGYLLKNLAADPFFEYIEGVARGEPALTPVLARKVMQEFARDKNGSRGQACQDQLTQREQEVLSFLVEGVTSNHDLAERLVVSENTVKYHLRNILDKLHLQDRAQVVGFALRNGLVEGVSGEGIKH